MLTYISRRLLHALPVLVGVVTLTFLFAQLTPGDPVDILLGDSASEIEKQELRSELGLNAPLAVQYLEYWYNLLHLDLGTSLFSKRPVLQMINERMPATLELALGSMFLALLFAMPTSILMNQSRWRGLKPVGWAYSVAGLSLPGVVIGPLLIWIFAIQLDLLPISERGGIQNLILPSLSLAIPLSSVLLRVASAALSEVSSEPFVQVLHAKGLSEIMIWAKHIFKKALTPIITIVGLQFGALITGTVITESIFDWPGIGLLLYEALLARDFPVIQSLILIVALLYVLVNLVTDLASATVNPRIAEDLYASQRNES